MCAKEGACICTWGKVGGPKKADVLQKCHAVAHRLLVKNLLGLNCICTAKRERKGNPFFARKLP